MMNFKNAFCTTVLLVDDDTSQLELRDLTMKMSGFSVLTATGPVEAISIMKDRVFPRIDVAVIDYHMPVINGCILAEYLRSRYPELKIVLHSGAIDIPEEEMSSVDAFSPKSDGVWRLLAKISEVQQIGSRKFSSFGMESNAEAQAAN